MSSNAYRFFEQQNFILNHKFILNKPNSHKIISVLRLQPDAIINIFNNTNLEFIAKIIDIKTNKLIEIQILQAIPKNLESPLKIHLAQAVAKHDNMDLIIQKAVELGVYEITPIITERTVVKIAANQISKKLEHWQAIATNACCQCGRNIVPKINDILFFKNFIINKNHGITPKFILSIINNNFNINKLNLDLTKQLALIIGPEGGFSTQELALAEQYQCIPITFGPRVLRTETAPIVALSILQAKYGDLLYINCCI